MPKVIEEIQKILLKLPDGEVVWKTGNGPITAAELRNHIQERTDLGRQFVSDVLRVCRDFISLKAQRN